MLLKCALANRQSEGTMKVSPLLEDERRWVDRCTRLLFYRLIPGNYSNITNILHKTTTQILI